MFQSIVKILPVAAILAASFVLTSCNDDDGGNGGGSETPTGTISATRIDGSNGNSSEWSMNNPSGIIDFSGLTISASNDDTGEILTMTIPGFEEGIYVSEGFDISGGVSSYTPQTDAAVFLSGSKSEAVHFVTITEVDSTNFTMSGEFQLLLFPADTAVVGSYFFQNGVFENVPVDVDLDFGGEGSSFSAKVDGDDFDSDILSSAEFFDNISISATESSSSRTISLNIPSDIAAGSHQIGVGSITASYSEGQTAFIGSSGTLVVESNNQSAGVLVATFEFEATNFGGGGETFSITEGSMTIDY